MLRKLLPTAALVLAVAASSLWAADASPIPAPNPALGQGKVVVLDEFFNHQVDKTGQPFHYIWSDTKNSGFSKFGDVWKENGAAITALDHAPTPDDLKKASIYIIVNPSTEKNAADHKPNYIDENSINTIEAWVKDGGVLLLLANDKNNSEFEHYNKLCERFGFTFDGNLRNTAPHPADRPHAIFTRARDHFPDHPLFNGLNSIYMKEISTITVKDPSTALFTVAKDPKESNPGDEGAGPDKDVIMFTAKVGKGTVFALGDPWIYNEYIDLAKPPVDNHHGAVNLVQWLLSISEPPQSK